MKAEFWHERWESGQIGFHQNRINDYLAKYWPRVQAPQGAKVLVPLAGKSLDMLWLRDQGHEVMGVELSALAVKAFFEENGINASEDQYGAFKRCSGENITLLCGDFFELTPADTADVGGFYDRASLIAMPPEMRPAYARHLSSLVPKGRRVLLVSIEYAQNEMDGPPFSVEQAEVEAMYGDLFDIEVLETVDALAQNERFRERGLTRLLEKAYLLTRR